MASSGSGSSGKRPLRIDLDRADEGRPSAWDMPWPIPSLNPSSSNPSSSNPSSSNPSSSSKKSKKSANPNWPPLEYSKEARCLGIEFYRRRSLSMLTRTYVNKNEDGYHQLTQDMRSELEQKLEASEQCNNFIEYWLASDWLDGLVTSLTTNIVAMWLCVAKKEEDKSDWDDEDKEFASKLLMVQTWCQGFSSSRSRTRKCSWKASAEHAIYDHSTNGSFKWLESSVKVVPMPGFKAEGAYGTIRKVRLTKLGSIPTWVEFAGKMLRMENLKEKRRETIIEAGACPVKHPGIIRLSYLHPKTMEAYTLWWNGGSLQCFQAYLDKKISETVSNDDILKQTDSGLSSEQLKWVATYRRNRVNLALAFLLIVAKCHDEGFLHNDLSPSNVLLHFDPWKQNVVYIGICDWGLCGRVVEKEPSKYGYATMGELLKVKALKRFVAPELFYTFGPPDSVNSIPVMQKKHLYTMEAEAYAAGSIAKRIWNHEWDPRYFTKRNPEQYTNLALKLKSLQEEDVNKRATVSGVLETLKQKPHCWSMPEFCYRR